MVLVVALARESVVIGVHRPGTQGRCDKEEQEGRGKFSRKGRKDEGRVK